MRTVLNSINFQPRSTGDHGPPPKRGPSHDRNASVPVPLLHQGDLPAARRAGCDGQSQVRAHPQTGQPRRGDKDRASVHRHGRVAEEESRAWTALRATLTASGPAASPHTREVEFGPPAQPGGFLLVLSRNRTRPSAAGSGRGCLVVVVPDTPG